MPGRHRGGQRHNKAVHDAERAERTCVFGKTKLCKFHILGTCTKGSDCHFAHHPDEMRALPDLSFSKLCRTLINSGRCEDPECKYAHGKEELRNAPLVALCSVQGLAPPEASLEELLRQRSCSGSNAEELLRQMVQPGHAGTVSGAIQQTSGAEVPPASSTRVLQRASRSFGSSLALIQEQQESDEESTSASDDARAASSYAKRHGLSPLPLDVNVRMGVTVKNTFIDLEPEQPSKLGFRAIKTAGGRLDLLWQES